MTELNNQKLGQSVSCSSSEMRQTYYWLPLCVTISALIGLPGEARGDIFRSIPTFHQLRLTDTEVIEVLERDFD